MNMFVVDQEQRTMNYSKQCCSSMIDQSVTIKHNWTVKIKIEQKKQKMMKKKIMKKRRMNLSLMMEKEFQKVIMHIQMDVIIIVLTVVIILNVTVGFAIRKYQILRKGTITWEEGKIRIK
ncbi:MAG: hypothetical protein EZS28_050449 [Streblomastix strix]|uniref:Uncharacterized protein n=1 Tax=Streblomastix strix TaxID=222440 RepID=A0A5J4T9E3_9EUKA|nr:MAG: hypothetical protein EZS28_050449 [Streblomastix strix]